MSDTILADSPVSFYRQLYTILRKELAAGAWKPGDRLPSEAELIAAYGVSRITVRQAFELLVNDGLVYRRRGSGTFVSLLPIEHQPNRITGFTADMHQRGMHPETVVLASWLEAASPDIARQLDIEPGAELAALERLRLADGTPISIELARLVHRVCPDVLSEDYASRSLRETLLERYGISLTRARQTVRAVAADEKLAERLQVPPCAPLLFVEQVTFQQSGIPLEFLQVYHRGDRYAFYNELIG